MSDGKTKNENKNNNFRSLLSTFQFASGMEQTMKKKLVVNDEHNDNNDNSSKSEEGRRNRMKERLEDIWRVTTLRHSMPQHPHKNEKEEEEENNHVHIAICMCVVDTVPQEAIWKEWMKSTSITIPCHKKKNEERTISVTAELYIHAKCPEAIKSEWCKSKLISESFRPNWNDVRVVRAMISLAEHAYAGKDPKMTHLVFCTESCLPITTLEQTAKSVLLLGSSQDEEVVVNWNQSFVDCYHRQDHHRCTRFDETSCFDILSPIIPSDAIYKALPGWITLCRKHVQHIIIDLPKQLSTTSTNHHDDVDHHEDVSLWPYFQHVWAPEEVYFPTVLALMGALFDTSSSSSSSSADSTSTAPMVHRTSLTWSKWDTHAHNPKDRARPFTYHPKDLRHSNLIQQARNHSGCLFLRKVQPAMDLTDWLHIINHNHRTKDNHHSHTNTRYKHNKRSRNHHHHHDDDDARWHNHPPRRQRRHYQSHRDNHHGRPTSRFSNNHTNHSEQPSRNYTKR